MKLSLGVFAALAALVVQAHDDDHDHEGHTCACEAVEFGFVIDCNDQDAMKAALAPLQSNDCATDCSSETCTKNFLIIQSHHDYCLHEEVPEEVEDALHIYEETCETCSILRKHDPDLPNCPDVTCADEGNLAYNALVDTQCLDACDTTECATHFRLLKATHDSCDQDALDTAAELAFHDYEDACTSFDCNVVKDSSENSKQLVCPDETSSVPRHTTSFAVLAGSALLLAAA